MNLFKTPLPLRVVLFVLAISLLLFSRRTDQFFHPAVWAEDGVIVLQDALLSGWKSLFWPVQGYLVISSRLLSLCSLWFGLEAYPFASTLLATAFSVFVLTYIAFTPSLLPRPALLAGAVVFIPTDAECFCLPLFSFWWCGVLLIAITLRENHHSKTLMRSDIALTALCSVSGVMAPLAALVFLVRRNVSRQMFPGLNACIITTILGTVIQAAMYLTHRDAYGASGVMSAYAAAPFQTLFHVLRKFLGAYVLNIVPAGSAWQWAVTAAGLVLLIGMIVHAIRARQWLFAYLGMLFGGCIALAIARVDVSTVDPILAGARYFFYPWILLSWWLLAQAQQMRGWSRVVSIIVLVLAALPLRHCWNKSAEPMDWTQQARAFQSTGEADFKFHTNGKAADAWRVHVSAK